MSKPVNYQKALEGILLTKSFRTEHLPFVTNRQVHHWKEIEVIDDHRKHASSGFKGAFSFLEALWIRMVIEMRSFRIGNNTIKQVKHHLFESSQQKSNSSKMHFIEAIQEVIVHKSTIYLAISSDGSTKLLNKGTYIEGLKEEQVTHHFSLRLDILIWKLIEILDFDTEINLIIE